MKATSASVRIRPLGGHTSSNKGAPVKNPTPGPEVYPLRGPVRAGIPENGPRGRIASNPGGPVIPLRFLRFRIGDPYTQWQTGNPEAG